MDALTVLALSNMNNNNTSGGDITLLGLLVVLITLALLGYWLSFWLLGWKDEAESKKIFLIQFFVPFLWWAIWFKDFIIEAIDDFKSLGE